MTGIIERSEGLDNPNIESWEIISRFIHPGDRVTIIGPGMSIFDDPSTLYISFLLKSFGQLYIADPRETFNNRSGTLAESGPCVGFGDVMRYLTELDFFRNNGMDMPIPVWLSKDFGILNLSKSPLMQNISVIYDHATTAFVADSFQKDRGHLQEVLDKFGDPKTVFVNSLKEYYQVLITGGNLILQTEDDSLIEENYIVESLMQKCGFSVVKYRVNDIFRMLLRPETTQALNSLNLYSEDILQVLSLDYISSLNNYIENKLDNNYLVCGVVSKMHNTIYHEAPNLYIATKI
jgi:hypothetical protein